MQQRLTKKSNKASLYDPYTFEFKDAKYQKEFDEYLKQKPIDLGNLKGQLIYNLMALPAFICYHYYHHVHMQRPYVPASFPFLFTVMMTHCSFFSLYVLEPTDDQNGKNEKERMINGERRMIAINVFIISALCTCGLVMHANLPLITYTSFFYKFDDGEVALEPFIISCFLNIYHHNLFPVHWWVIVTAWFLQLLLILCIWLPFAHTQSIHSHNTTTILLLFYVAMLFINYRIHEFKLREFLFTESFSLNLNNDPSHVVPTPRNLDESKIISDYLAEMYSRSPSVTENNSSEDVMDSRTTSSAVSSVSLSRVPVLHHRHHHHHSSHNDDDHTMTSTITNGLTAASSFVSESTQEKSKLHNSRKPYLAREKSLY